MSEHTYLTSKIEYAHLPYRENGFTWCRHCKKFVKKATVGFHEGIVSDWMELKCGHCNKTIWVCSFKEKDIDFHYTLWDVIKRTFNRVFYFCRVWRMASFKAARGMFKKDEKDDTGERIFPKDIKKCYICKKKTNHYDSVATVYDKNKEIYLCSDKCYKKYDLRK